MAPSHRSPTSHPLSPGASTGPAVVADPEIVLFEADDAGRLPDIPGPRVHRTTSSLGLRQELRTLRRGVIAVAAPPATADDIEFVAQARANREGLRAILITEPDDAATRLDALARGFDDAVPVSVGADEIVGRIRVLAERTRGEARDRLPVGFGTELDLTARALRRNGRLVHLRPMEFRLLEELARNPGRPITREWLLRRVWGSDGLDGSRTVDVHMRWLRAKVERDPDRPEHLLTVRGVGYQLELGAEIVDGMGHPVSP